MLICQIVVGQIVLKDEQVVVSAAMHAETFRDTTEMMSIEEVMEYGGFQPHEDENFFLRYREYSVLWVKLRLKNESSKKVFLIDVPNATIDDFQFYEPLPSGFRMQQAGDAFPYRYREVFARAFAFQINLKEFEEKEYYLRINANGDAINTDINIWQPVGYLNQTANEKYVFGLYYGAISFIIVFHFFLYFRLRDKSLIYYMLYILSFATTQLVMDGFMSKYFLPEFPWLVNRLLPAAVYMSAATLVGFFQYYQSTSQYHITAHKRLNFVKYCSWALALSCFLTHEIYLYLLPVASIYALASLMFVLVTAGLALRSQPVLARYFIGAFIVMALGVVIGISRTWGLFLPGSEYSIKIGAAAEIIVLAIALAEKFKIMEEKTNQLALDRLENLNALKDNYSKELEKTVHERTAALEKSNQNIKDSIRYAKRIQSSLLPNETLLTNYFAGYFNYYLPRDIVSGDFYWFGQTGNTVVIAVVDCTGHGVPGAFMSILGINSMHEIVNVKNIDKPDLILHAMNASIRKSLQQHSEGVIMADGMDVALICYDLDTREVHFSGAKRPLLYFSKGELNVIKGSRYTVGGKKGIQKEYERHTLKSQDLETLYLFTDGYADQFGGVDDRKFMIRRFKELLEKIQTSSMNLQMEYIDHSHQEWKGNGRQLDDILIVGLKFS